MLCRSSCTGQGGRSRRRYSVSAAAGNDVRNLVSVISKLVFHLSRVSLIDVSMAREDRMGTELRRLDAGINISQHLGASAMRTVSRKRRMVHRYNGCTDIIFDGLELLRQKLCLPVVETRVVAVLARNHPEVFECVAVQSDDGHERRLQGKVDAGLRHRSS